MISTNILLLQTISANFGVFFFTKKKNKEKEEENDQMNNTLLCRFVTDHSGKKIGESVSINEDIMIIKSGSRFLGVPLKHIEEKEKTLMVKALLDFNKAYEMGEKWRKASLSELENEPEGNQNGL